MRKSFFCVFTVIIFILGALSPTISSAQAQTPPPLRQPERQEPCLPGQPCEDENGERFIIPTEETLAEPNGIGDSDDYGYTLTSTSYSWIEANGGTKTFIDSYDDITAAIPLPFPFPFYENSYSQLYITGAGYVTFDDFYWVSSYLEIPDKNEPNNLISPLTKGHTYSGSAVYFRNFGTHFVIQWNNVKDGDGGVYTFEAVLYPNGNIKFQYKTLPDPNQGYWCSTAGIENAAGTDGLVFWNYCDYPTTAGTAVLFTKPGPSARVWASPLYLGGFTYSLEVDEFRFTLANSGDLGADTYDMVVTTAPLAGGWTVDLFDAATDLPLSDTDSDGAIDSGSLAQGASKEILVRVSAPDGLVLGSAIKTYVEISSSLDSAKTKTVTIESTVPAAFAQTYQDNSEQRLWTDLSWPVTQKEVNVHPDALNVKEPAIIETPNHNFVHVWGEFVHNQNVWGWILRYALMDRFGEIIKAPANLSSLYDVANYYTSHGQPALAVTADGKIGVVWTSVIENPANQDNYNIWLAILNPSGSLAYGPVNLSNNDAWGSWQAGNMNQMLYSPDISASSDNRFFVSWARWIQGTDSEDIFYTIRQSSGAVVVPVTAMTASVPGSSWYYRPVQIALTGNRIFLTYTHYWISGQNCYEETLYRVLDSNGATLTPPSSMNISPSTAVQLSGGNILLAVAYYQDDIPYQIRNGTTYALIAEGVLSHPSNLVYTDLSLTRDANNRGILTWSDPNNRYLFYAYVSGSNGALLSGPVIFHRSDNLRLSQSGSGVTTNSWSPTAGIDLVGSFSSSLFGAAPGGLAMLQMQNSNIGAKTAEFPELTLTLPPELTYVGDTSGITPNLVGNMVVWQLAELGYGSSEDFVVYLAVDGATTVPSFLDITMVLSSEGVDVNPGDNTDSAQVLVGPQIFLPMMLR